MTDTKLIARPLDRLNQNKLALGAAVEELSNGVEQRGSADIANNVRGALEMADENLVFIRRDIAELTGAGSLDKTREPTEAHSGCTTLLIEIVEDMPLAKKPSLSNTVKVLSLFFIQPWTSDICDCLLEGVMVA